MMIVLPIFETQNGDNLVDNPMTIIPLHIVSYHSPTVMAQIGGTTIAIVHTHTHNQTQLWCNCTASGFYASS